MMLRWISGLVCLGALAAGSAHAATSTDIRFDLKRGAVKMVPMEPQNYDLRVVFEGEDWSPALPESPRNDFSASAATAAMSRAVAVMTPRGNPVELNLNALAGHRSFDTIQRRRSTLGWSVTSGGNDLGVGMTGTYGIRVAKGWRMTPFVSLDYNRIDTARYIDAASPHPYTTDNGDTGMTGTIGAALSHRFGVEKRFRALAFGSMVAATSTGVPPREFGSVGARLVNALGNSAVKAVWEETGFGLDYRLTSRARLNGAILQTIDRMDGDTVAAKFGLRVAL